MDSLTIALKNADGITADVQVPGLYDDTSVLEVKQMLASSYPGQPPASAQKIVYAGRSVPERSASSRERRAAGGVGEVGAVCMLARAPAPGGARSRLRVSGQSRLFVLA